MDASLETRLNQFQDAEGRRWTVRVTVGKIRKAREFLGIDLNDAIDPNKDVIDRLANDPVLMFDVIYLCCQEQLDRENVTAEDFSDAINGETIEQAAAALIAAIVDFFPKSKTEVIRQGLAIQQKMVSRIKKKAMDALQNLTDEELDEAVDKMVQELGNSSTTAPVSSA